MAAFIASIPADATITGLFLAGVRDLAKARGVTLSRARPSYVSFKPYPLREHAELLIECADAVFGALPPRQALRKMGRGAAGVLIASHVGRVVFGSVEGPIELVRAMARSYALHVRPGSVTAEPDGPGRIIVRMRDIHYFLDSHHVGVFEGVLKHAGLSGEVSIASTSPSDADLLVTWR